MDLEGSIKVDSLPFFSWPTVAQHYYKSLENGMKGMNIRSVDDTKPDPWMFSVDNCKILHLDRNNQMHG